MPNYELVAQNAYSIFRGSQRGENEKLFPHVWDDLPRHYRDLLTYVAEFSWMTQITPGADGEDTFQVPVPRANG